MANPSPTRALLEDAFDTAARAPSRENRQPWLWHVDGAGVHLRADWERRAGDTPADRRDVLLGCGAVLDHCVVALAAAGWYPRVHRFPERADDGTLALLEVVEQPPRPAVVELARAIPRRRADRRPFTADDLPPGTLEMLHVRAARLQVELSVVPRTRWARSDDGDISLRFATDEAPAEDGVLLVIATSRDDDAMRLRAGEAMSHVLLSAATLGLASCPITEPLNDIRDRLALACEVFDGESYPQVLIRLGRPRPDAAPLAPVERRPVSANTTWAGTGEHPLR